LDKTEDVHEKLINSADTVLEESLDGSRQLADILLLSAERKFVRRRTLETGQGRVDFGWRFGT
jgi:hypothetical protein